MAVAILFPFSLNIDVNLSYFSEEAAIWRYEVKSKMTEAMVMIWRLSQKRNDQIQ